MVGIGAKVEGATTYLPNGDLRAAVNSATDGDVIILTGDTYSWATLLNSYTKGITIKADPSLTTRPVVTFSSTAGAFMKCTPASLKTITFDGIDFNGAGIATGLITPAAASGGDIALNINSCVVRNIAGTSAILNYTAQASLASGYSNLNVTNSRFIGFVTLTPTIGSKTSSPKMALFRNCYFSTYHSTGANMYSLLGGTGCDVTFDHCTINKGPSSSKRIILVNAGSVSIVKNCVIANELAGTTGVLQVNTDAASTNNTFYLCIGVLSTRFPNIGPYTDTADPGIPTLPAVGSLTTSDADYFSTSGKGYYKNASITKSASSLSGFTYNVGSGPSSAQTFNVSGADLFNNLTITAPENANYEISSDGTTYVSSLSFSPTLGVVTSKTIYVRLVSGLGAGSKTGDITLSSANVTTQTIALTGAVNAGGSPSITATGSPLSGFNYLYANGPSTSLSFTVSGSNLTEGITVTPSASYEVSSDNVTFSPTTPIVIGAAPSVSSTTVHVRLKAGLSGGSYNSENVAVSSTSAATQNVVCSGTVTPPTITLSTTTLGTFNAATGSVSPSAERLFTVSGTNLAGDITVTAPTSYEISTTSGVSFSSASPITILQANAGTPTTIYVRLKGSLAANSYVENVAISTVGASNSNVACTGVVATPTVNLGRDVITNTYLTYTLGGGPSSGRDCTVSGTNLVSDIVVTCPANFEIASDAAYTTATIGTLTFTNVNGSATGTVYSRLKSGLLTDSYSGNVSFASTSAVYGGASADNLLALSGSVTGGAVIWGTTANAAITTPGAFSYAGAGPSTISNNLKITCSGLSSAVTVTPSAGFEVSTDSISFQSSEMSVANDGAGNIAAGKKIYTRMVSGLSLGAKTGTITLTATGATTRTVTVNGTVSFSGSVSASNTNISSMTLSPSSQITVAADATLTLDQNTNVSSITVAAGGKLSIPTTGTTVSGTITLQSSAAGTATLVDDYASPTRTATVQQYLSSARNWYFTPALTGVTVPASSTYFGYEEAGDNIDLSATGASAYWKPYATGASLTAGKGYIIQSGGANTLSFTNTTVSGDVSPVLTYNTGKGNGYNLVGNPYPSYLSWSAVYNYDAANGSTANMPTGTIWYRTVNYNGKSAWAGNTSYNLNEIVYNGVRFYKVVAAGTSAATGGPSGSTASITDGGVTWDYQGSVYVFATVNAAGQATPSIVNNLIPPMQAFWVKTATGGGTLRFKNSMRSHNTTGGTNALKAPKSTASDIKLIRLNVSNGASTDEAVIYASANASNAFDSYDAPKYFNNAGSNQAEIYTQVGSEKLVINAMNELSLGTEIPLGFATEKANNFTLSASEFTNFGSDTKVILKDNQMNTEFDLTAGQSYAFSSAVVNNTNRFSLLFRAPGTTTGIKNSEKLNAQVFVNAANQITIIAPEKSSYAIFNALGQLIENGTVNSKLQTANSKQQSGIYVVKVGNETTRVIVK